MRLRRISVSIQLVITLMFGVLEIHGQQPVEKWCLDLHASGYKESAPKDKMNEAFLTARNTLALDHKDRLAVGFITRDESGVLITRESAPFSFHVVLIDSKTGKIQSSRTWPLRNTLETGLYWSSSDKLIVKAGPMLELYTNDYVLATSKKAGLSFLLQLHSNTDLLIPANMMLADHHRRNRACTLYNLPARQNVF